MCEMKNILINITLILVLSILPSCSSFLDEEPKSLLTAQYLESESGINSALISAYSDLRYFFGTESGLALTVYGTDEFQKGPDGNLGINMYEDGTLLTNGLISSTWNWGYTAINTVNSVITYAAGSGMATEDAKRVVAEAKYLRALWYFIMVQTYGPMPLNLEFITEPSTEAVKSPVSDIYASVIRDIEEAKADLPPTESEPGRASAAAACHLLSKVYLARATHEEAKQGTDYQNAYDNAMHLINNKGMYNLELLADFADVHRPGNEYSTEVIFRVERNTDYEYNESNYDEDNGNRQNRSSFFFRPNYSAIVPGLVRDIENGRPWHRTRPTNYLLEVAFADRTYDTRYDKTFQTIWNINDPDNVEDPSFHEGDIAIWLPGYETYDNSVKALKIFTPSFYYGNENSDGTSIYPSMSKYDDIDRENVQWPSVRPFIVFRFAETYLNAAEAAMYLGKSNEAKELVNVLRRRAAYDPNRPDAENATAVTRMLNETPSFSDPDEGMNFLLDERSRELCGEYMRWFDLARTRTTSGESMLLNRINNLEPTIPAKGHVKSYHILRPIPQNQIDLTSNDFQQNPGYN